MKKLLLILPLLILACAPEPEAEEREKFEVDLNGKWMDSGGEVEWEFIPNSSDDSQGTGVLTNFNLNNIETQSYDPCPHEPDPADIVMINGTQAALQGFNYTFDKLKGILTVVDPESPMMGVNSAVTALSDTTLQLAVVDSELNSTTGTRYLLIRQ